MNNKYPLFYVCKSCNNKKFKSIIASAIAHNYSSSDVELLGDAGKPNKRRGNFFLYSLVALFSVFNTLHSQQTSEAVTEKLQTQLAIFPQEKLHLHLDKEVYAPGEQIQFRAYLVDAASHLPVSKSRYIYAELINRENIVLSKVRISPDSLDLYHGYLPVPIALKAGDYNIHAYTSYMKNRYNTDHLFQKSIQVVSGSSTNSDKQGLLSDFNIQFFPEGGLQPANVLHQMAFKAIGNDGLHQNVKGIVLDEKHNRITSFTSTHSGMGVFTFEAQPAKTYYAECTNESGQKKVFPLPVATESFSLQVRHSSDSIAVSVSQSAGIEYPTDSLFLLIHTRGQLQYWGSWNPLQAPLLIDRNSLPSGISQVVLLDAQNRKISERLLFALQNDFPQVSLTDGKEKKGTMTLHFSIRTNDTIAAADYCSVAITDNDICPDSTSHIISDLLLMSDLNGSVENPAYYLQPDNRQAMNAADLLMMTQGWKRYDIGNLLNHRYISPAISYETVSSTDEKEDRLKIFDLPNASMAMQKGTKPSKDFSFYDQYCSNSLNRKDIEKKRVTHTDELLIHLPGMLAYRNFFQTISRGTTPRGKSCLVVVNDQLMQSYFDINQIEPSSITSIGVISGPQMAVFGREGAPVLDRERMTTTPQHALVISTKEHEINTTDRSKNNTTILYWNPTVKVDKDFSISFDVPDQIKSYHVVLEGILHNGEIVRSQYMF